MWLFIEKMQVFERFFKNNLKTLRFNKKIKRIKNKHFQQMTRSYLFYFGNCNNDSDGLFENWSRIIQRCFAEKLLIFERKYT